MRTTANIEQIPVGQIVPGDNDRHVFDQVALEELADSIREHGLAQPITVRPIWFCSTCGHRDSDNPLTCEQCGGDNLEERYEIVAGERRFRAVLLLGWETIPAIVREGMSDEAASAVMLAENLQRAGLNLIEEAQAYRKRMDQFGWSLEDISRQANVTKQHICHVLPLLDLVPEAQKMVAHGQLTLQYAYSLRDLDSNRQRIALRWLRDQETLPGTRKFKEVCAALLTEQAQEAMFDMARFMVEIEAAKKDEASPERHIPIDDTLPVMLKARSVGAALERYICDLVANGHTEAARVVGSVYMGLLQYNLASMPARSPLCEIDQTLDN